MAGRSAPQKEELARRITQAVVEIGGTRPEDVWVVFQDVEAQDWMTGVRPPLPADGAIGSIPDPGEPR